jgi:DNA invertase Pin-like site-specific DNA recombinase
MSRLDEVAELLSLGLKRARIRNAAGENWENSTGLCAGIERRCAIYTRKSTEHNLDLEFNSLDAQREACEAYIKSQAHEGWRLLGDHYDDGGVSGASLERPALQTLLSDIRAGRIDIVVVYKVDRLTRSLADFAKLVELFDRHAVSFVSITQSFNTTSSMGRLTLNVLLSFAQFEREVIGERVRDKIAASKRVGDRPPDLSAVRDAQVDHQGAAGARHRRRPPALRAALRQGRPAQDPEEPDLHRPHRPQEGSLPWQARGHHRRRASGPKLRPCSVSHPGRGPVLPRRATWRCYAG